VVAACGGLLVLAALVLRSSGRLARLDTGFDA